MQRRRRNYRLKKSIELFREHSTRRVLDFVFFLCSIFQCFILQLNSTKSFSLDLQVLPSNIGYVVLISEFRLELAREFPHEPIYAGLESLCSSAEPMVWLNLSRLVIYTKLYHIIET